MSDSVTNVDVEDVLSSIRRLVSDTNSDERPNVRPESDAGDARPTDALLLTSALRVPPSSEAEDDDVEAEQPEAANLSNLRDAISEQEAASDWQHAETSEYYEDEETDEDTPVISFIRHERAAPIEDDFEASDEAFEFTPVEHEADAELDEDAKEEEEVAENDVDWSLHPNDDSEETSEHDLSEVEMPEWIEAGHAEIEEAEEAQAEPTEEASDALEPEDAEDAQPGTAEVHEDEPEEPNEDVLEVSFDDADDDAEAPEVDEAEEHFEPEGEVHDAEAIFAAAAAASVFTEDEPEENTGEGDDAASFADFEETILDEDALRDLVSEIVRKELTGELGERITRNVRKLVRREIHRALVTREFE